MMCVSGAAHQLCVICDVMCAIVVNVTCVIVFNMIVIYLVICEDEVCELQVQMALVLHLAVRPRCHVDLM